MRLVELNSFSHLFQIQTCSSLCTLFKKAVISSQIEGTKTNIKKALIEEKEIEPERRDD